VLRSAKKHGVKGGTICIGRGTVASRLLAFLKLDEVRREVVTMIIENELASRAIEGIGKDMEFEKPHHGIAFSYSVSEFVGSRNQIESTTKAPEGKNAMYNVIYAVVERGKGEDAIEAAEKAGSKGGTILNARGAGVHEVKTLFSLEIEPEKELVFIITKKEKKDAIVEAIKERLRIDEPGNGVLFVLDVNEAYGLHEG
jgi:nitrogen regulatory protein PII